MRVIFWILQIYPHGGMKNSGFGRFNGREGIREFLQTKVCSSCVQMRQNENSSIIVACRSSL